MENKSELAHVVWAIFTFGLLRAHSEAFSAVQRSIFGKTNYLPRIGADAAATEHMPRDGIAIVVRRLKSIYFQIKYSLNINFNSIESLIWFRFIVDIFPLHIVLFV